MRIPAAARSSFLLLLASCSSPVGVDRTGFDVVFHRVEGDALTTAQPSASTVEILRQLGLHEAWDDAPRSVLENLHQVAVADGSRDALCALAELCLLAAEDADDGRPLFLSSACYAWFYLFDESSEREHDAFDPRFRLACDLYGRALAQAFLDDEEESFIASNGPRDLAHGTIDVTVDVSGLPFSLQDFESLVPTAALEIEGLAHRHRRAGLGTCLLGIRPPTANESIDELFAAPRGSTLTAVLRPHGGVAALADGRLDATLEFLWPVGTKSFRVGDRDVPLESDSSVALAFALQGSDLFDLETSSFFGGDLEDFSGLYFMRPYDPTRIPVVFIHGTSSSLARWADILNDLVFDDEIRDRYQFWFFTYLSGRPVPLSANILRRSLLDARHRYDPEGDDAAFEDLVLVAHSQGGLLSRQMVVDDPDERIWNTLFNRPISEIEAEPESLDELRQAFLSPPVPFVKRAIYLATPHRGSYQADRWLVGIVRAMITLPRRALKTTLDVVTRNQDAFRTAVEGTPTSLDTMKTDNPVLLTLASLAVPEGVKQHSIIAIDGDDAPPEGDDGVVEYVSAHLESADSEIVVRSGHSCQAHPQTILEIKRILREHAAER